MSRRRAARLPFVLVVTAALAAGCSPPHHLTASGAGAPDPPAAAVPTGPRSAPRFEPPAPPPPPWIVAWWEQQVLPSPRPSAAPGEMLVGWPVYLEAHTVTTWTGTTPQTPDGTAQVTATSTLHVSWGDGTSTGPYHDAGGPWPDGTITHVYQAHDRFDVTVTQRWEATYEVDPTGERGTLPARTTRGSLDDFPTREVQAVGL